MIWLFMWLCFVDVVAVGAVMCLLLFFCFCRCWCWCISFCCSGLASWYVLLGGWLMLFCVCYELFVFVLCLNCAVICYVVVTFAFIVDVDLLSACMVCVLLLFFVVCLCVL